MHTQKNIQTILVVDDDVAIREILQSVLESEGYHVIAVENGKKALEKMALSPKPCLVLLDMMMPVMNGREFLDAVQLNEELKPIPIVVVSATSDADQARGAIAVVRKPTDIDFLLKTVSAHCDKFGTVVGSHGRVIH